jgi:hypothetical protein
MARYITNFSPSFALSIKKQASLSYEASEQFTAGETQRKETQHRQTQHRPKMQLWHCEE